jgi:hypothetical protein
VTNLASTYLMREAISRHQVAIKGQLGDEFGQHVPDEGGNQPPSAIQWPQLLGPARTQSRRKLYQRQSEAIRGNQRQSEAIRGNQRQSEAIREAITYSVAP